MNEAVSNARQQHQINPIQPVRKFYNVSDFIDDLKNGAFTPSKPIERVPLGTSVFLCNGVEAAISGHSTCDCNSYRVSWFDRKYWTVRHKWVQRGGFEVIQTKTLASSVEVSVS